MAIIVGNQEVCEIIIENSANENNDTNKFRMNKTKQQQVNILSIR